MNPRLIAFNLPQFHPIPENDEWWGKGFTEWTNVSRARPVFRGHYQPHLPADLGFYDLRLPEARQAQADLAREYGISGFCYYHYWFEGKRLLERPVNEILASGDPDFPFCLCWANESWSRTWLGEEKEVLQKQSYSAEDDVAHAAYLAEVFTDPRYIRHKGRPVFLVYNLRDHPNVAHFCAALRKACKVDPYLVGVDSRCPFKNTRELGFDTTLHFEPMLSALPGVFSDKWSIRRLKRNLQLGIPSGRLKVFDYKESRRLMNRVQVDHPMIPCVLVGWDNAARRGAAGSMMVGNTPEAFEGELRSTVASWRQRPNQDDFVFINAWNEWAEGNHLEPDQKWGRGYLEAVRRVMQNKP